MEWYTIYMQIGFGTMGFGIAIMGIMTAIGMYIETFYEDIEEEEEGEEGESNE